jgi:hypothetical protein
VNEQNSLHCHGGAPVVDPSEELIGVQYFSALVQAVSSDYSRKDAHKYRQFVLPHSQVYDIIPIKYIVLIIEHIIMYTLNYLFCVISDC